MKMIRTLCLPALAVAGLSMPHPAFADFVTDWNRFTFETIKAGGQNSNLGTRIGAIASIAVYDAINAARPYGTPYHFVSANHEPASIQAAAAQAAHDVLVNYLPSRQAAVDARLAQSLSQIPEGPEKSRGIALGAAAAADIIALRSGDGSSPNLTYAGPLKPGVGEWRPTPGAAAGSFPPGINQQWGGVTPFLLPSGSVYRVAAPPAVGSPEYQSALEEVTKIGAIGSETRTSDQTHVAQFYKQDAELLVNEAARQLAEAHGLSPEENALLLALVNIALADARIAIWDSKYFYNYWRPVTALNADSEGAVTNGYSAWNPLLVTPSHPSYPSGHSGTVNAGVEVLKDFFGNRKTLVLSTTTPGEPARVVNSLAQIEEENGLSRIYGGIHYTFDNLQGQALGNRVAAFVLKNGPRPLRASGQGNIVQLATRAYTGVTLQGQVGQSYRIEYTDHLPAETWTPWRYVTPLSQAPAVLLDQTPNASRFFRAVSVSNAP